MDFIERTVQIRVTGKVQGVFYRATARDVANDLGLNGWVRNCTDGSVEILAGGSATAIEALIAWCRKGPREARVDEVIVTDVIGTDTGKGFRIDRA
jgi:acylphosphatase